MKVLSKENFKKNANKFSLFIILLVLIVISSIANSNFFTVGNINNIIRQLTVPVLLAYGEMLLIISGMIDLSSASVLALSGVLSVSTYKMMYVEGGNDILPLFTAILVAVLVAVLCNIVNATIIVKFSVPPFIATLGMQMAARGLALYYTNGQNILQIKNYKVFGHGEINFGLFRMSVPMFVTIIITVIMWYIMNQTKFGRSMYAIGGNEEASRASGINVHTEKYKAFIVNGILVGLAGVIFMSRVNSGQPNGATGYEMDGLTAAIVGGTSFSGGAGTTIGTLVGAYIVGILTNIMNILSVNSYIQQIVKGAIISAAVIWDINSKKIKRTTKILEERSEKEKVS